MTLLTRVDPPGATPPPGVADDEWAARLDLAAAYRLAGRFGWHDLLGNHFSVRVPGTADQYLINPWGFFFEEITASSLVKVDTQGNVLSDTVHGVNPAVDVIHTAIYAARPDVASVTHLHSVAGTGVASQAGGLLPISQNALLILHRVRYHAFEGAAIDPEERARLGETITETLEVIPRQWKVIQTVRERFSCRACETISQPPAPFHTTPRGWAGPNLLATLLFEKFGQHQPLNRQAERFAREGVPLSLSTLVDQVGTAAAVLKPLHDLIAAHVMAAGRLHGDDTPVPVLAKGKTDTGRLWVYVRDDRPFAGQAPPAALFHYSRDRKGEHPERHLAGFTGWLQADAFAG